MFKTIALSAALALGLGATGAHAAGAEGHVEDFDFSFEGPFGTYDQNQLQRGLKIYTQVCAGCHGLKFVPIRSLSAESGPGLPEDQVRAYAEQNFEVFDEELDDFRPARPTDNFPANNGVGAPDLSLMAKARAGFHGPYGTGINQFMKGIGGPEYIASLLTGYTGEDREQAGTILYENTAFPGGWISMAPPLYGEDVEFDDGHENDLESEAKDVAAFLMWTAEPKMMARKQAGFVGVLFLTVLSVLLYLALGAIGLPVFAEHTSGLGTFTQPSAGYLLSFPVAALVAGLLVTYLAGERGKTRAAVVFLCSIAGSILVIHPAGIIGLMVTLDMSVAEAFRIDVLYWVGDLLKTTMVALIAAEVHRAFPRLLRARGARPARS